MDPGTVPNMSVMLDNGWKIEMNGRDMFALLQEVKTAVDTAYRTVYRATIASVAADIHDDITLAEAPGETRHIRNAPLIMQAAFYLDGVHRHVSTTREKHLYDLRFAITFIPGDANVIYALVDTEQGAMRDAFDNIDGVTWWPYWDSVDRPSAVSKTDWEERGNTWAKLLGDDNPETIGLNWRLLDVDGHDVTLWTHPDERIAELVPNVQRRASRLAVIQVHREVNSRHEYTNMSDLCTALNRALVRELPDVARATEETLTPITIETLWTARQGR